MKATSSARVVFIATGLFAFGSPTPGCRDEPRPNAPPAPKAAARQPTTLPTSAPSPATASRLPPGFPRNLTPEQVQEYEELLKTEPDNLDVRSQLLHHYSRARFSDPKVRAARYPHIMWIIGNRPEARIAGQPEAGFDPQLEDASYTEAAKLWSLVLDSRGDEPAVLGNAASFFLLHDREKAESLFIRAQELEPANPQWSKQLGQLYKLNSHRGIHGEVDAEAAKKSLDAFESALASESGPARSHSLVAVARAALDAGELDKARNYANELLACATELPGGMFGDEIHHGNIVLGRIALLEGDIETAEACLLKAGAVTGSPVLNSFGPNMSLAKELLEAGRREVVVDYLRACGKFWKRSELDDWIVLIEGNRTPNFGANLRY